MTTFSDEIETIKNLETGLRKLTRYDQSGKVCVSEAALFKTIMCGGSLFPDSVSEDDARKNDISTQIKMVSLSLKRTAYSMEQRLMLLSQHKEFLAHLAPVLEDYADALDHFPESSKDGQVPVELTGALRQVVFHEHARNAKQLLEAIDSVAKTELTSYIGVQRALANLPSIAVGLVRVIALVKEQVSAKFLDGALCQNITDNKDAVEKVQTAMVTMFDELSSKFDHLRNDLEQVTEGQTIVRKTRLPSPPVRKFKLAYNK